MTSTLTEKGVQPVGRGGLTFVVGMVVRPRTAWTVLQEARQRRAWIPALLMLALLLPGAYAFVRMDAVYRYRQALAWYERQPEGTLSPPELAATSGAAVLRRAGIQAAALLVRWASWAALLLGVTRLIGQRSSTVDDALAVTLWSWLPYVVRGLLQVGITAVTASPIYNPGLAGMVVDNTPPALSAFRYSAPTTGQRALATLLGNVDIFGLWQIGLLASGLVIFAQVPVGKARWLSIALWVLVLLLSLVLR